VRLYVRVKERLWLPGSPPTHVSRIAVIAMVIVTATLYSIVAGGNIPSAFAVQAQPPTDWSFYVTAYDDAEMATLGCNQGHFDASQFSQ
jgi:hypothetical protein